MKVRFDFDYYVVTKVDKYGFSYITWGDGTKGAIDHADFPHITPGLKYTIDSVSFYLKALKCYLQEE